MPRDVRISVVTGGASGIGRALVERVLDTGGRAVIADLDVDTGEAFHRELVAAGHGEHACFVPADVSSEADVEAVADAATSAFGHIDAWFNNAGTTGIWAPITEISVEDFDRTVAVILRATFVGTRAAARRMIERGHGGSIVNTASLAGLSGGAGPMVYSAAKAGVLSMTRSNAAELGAHRIRVNAVCPGAILTPMMHRGDVEGAKKRLEGRQPWPEHGTPEHVAAVMDFLASDDAEFVTGQEVVVDGGLLAQGIKVMPASPPPTGSDQT